MDEIERNLQKNFAPLEQNFKNMEVGLKWVFGRIYALLGFIAIPIEKGLKSLFGMEEGNSKGDDWL